MKNDGEKRVDEITAEEAEEGKHAATFTPGLVSATPPTPACMLFACFNSWWLSAHFKGLLVNTGDLFGSRCVSRCCGTCAGVHGEALYLSAV